MRAAVMHSLDPDLSGPLVTIEDVPAPEPAAPHDVVVRVAAAGVCRSDLHLLTGGLPVPLPHVLGHENAGFVHAVGPAVTSVSPGDPVACYPFLAPGLGPGDRAAGAYEPPAGATPGMDADGGYAEFLRSNESAMVRLPAGTDPVPYATLTDAGLAAYRACKKALPSIEPGATVAVLGVGGLGHIALQILATLTDAHLIGVDPRPDARELAAGCGAARTLEDAAELASRPGAAAVLDFVGSDASTAAGLASLRFGGLYLAVGVGGSLTAATVDVVAGEKRIEGVFVGDYGELVELVELTLEGRVRPRVVRYPLGDAARALRDLATGAYVGRAVLVP